MGFEDYSQLCIPETSPWRPWSQWTSAACQRCHPAPPLCVACTWRDMLHYIYNVLVCHLVAWCETWLLMRNRCIKEQLYKLTGCFQWQYFVSPVQLKGLEVEGKCPQQDSQNKMSSGGALWRLTWAALWRCSCWSRGSSSSAAAPGVSPAGQPTQHPQVQIWLWSLVYLITEVQ